MNKKISYFIFIFIFFLLPVSSYSNHPNDLDLETNEEFVINSPTGSRYFTFEESGGSPQFGIGTEDPDSALHIDTSANQNTSVMELENNEGAVRFFLTDGTPDNSLTANVGDIAIDASSETSGLYFKHDTSSAGWQLMPTLIHFDASPTTTSGTGAGFRTMKSFTVPADTLTQGTAIRVIVFARRASGSGNAAFRMTYGGSTVAQMGNNGNNPIQMDLVLIGVTDNSQRGYLYHANSGNTGTATNTATESSASDQIVTIDMDPTSNTSQWTCDFVMATVLKP